MSSEFTPTVLVIDDMRDIGELTSTYLERHDMDTFYEENPEKAIEEYDLTEITTDIDCVVCDYDMPQMTGLDVLDYIRRTNPRIPFILYTGKGSEEIASEAITMGVTDYIQKDSGPNHYALLANRITNAVEKSKAEEVRERSIEKEVLREIKDIFVENQSIQEKQEALLNLGSTYLDMPAGFISHISETHMNLITTYGIDQDGLEGLRHCPLEKTYCRHAVTMDEPLLISNASEEGLEDDPAYKAWNIESYIGSRILVDGEVYGTVCFIDVDNTTEFNESDKMFIDLLAQWLGYEIHNHQSTQRLRRQNENLEEFTSLVRHDLKNPLSVCLGHLDLMKEEFDNPHIDKIEDSVNKMNLLIDDFTLLSKAIGELDEEDMETLKIGPVIDDVWGSQITEESSVLTIEEDCRNHEVKANLGLLKQVFQNLFCNAVEHNETPVEITMRKYDKGFIVEDNGSGIEDTTGSIFEKGVTSGENSTGYGLYITKKIIDSHGWSIDFESDDSGTRFYIDTTSDST